MSVENWLDSSLRESVETKTQFWKNHKQEFLMVARALMSVIHSGNKVMIFGNGGSACDALHFAGEWVNRYSRDRKPLPCIALTADAPLLTCIANDGSFDHIFERQVRALGRPGDVAIGITTSGNSKNVALALSAAREIGVTRVVLLGGNGGKILTEKNYDLVLLVDSSNVTARIQETHEWILHSLCEYVDHELLGPPPAASR